MADHGAYRTKIHRPVFDWLVGDMDEGFIQVDWEPVTGLPARVSEELEVYPGGGKFAVVLDTAGGSLSYENRPPYVKDDARVTRFRSGWAARLALKREKREKHF